MTTITFDTHKFISTIKASGIAENQAEAIADPMPGVCLPPLQSCTMSHDQNFKNLIVDYPPESVRLFAASESPCA